MTTHKPKQHHEHCKMVHRAWSMAITATTALLLLAACAKQGYPSGGPRDTKPPTVTACNPTNESRNLDAKQFEITFDEYVVIKDASNNILVSPPMATKPDYSTKGKRIVVKLNDTLLPNTTYLFQFKEAIADYTEGNLLPTFEYVFATGPEMDTMKIVGTVTNAHNGKPWPDVVSVMAYKEERFVSDSTDTIAVVGQPDYMTRCDKDGNFALNHIPAGRYRLVAIADNNRNMRADVAEATAWMKEPVTAADSIDSLAMPALRISSPDNRKQRLQKAEFTRQGHITISTLLPMVEPTLTGEKTLWHLNSRRDTIEVWLMDRRQDSAVLILNDITLNDTLRLHYRPASRPMGNTSLAMSQPGAIIQPLCDGNKAYYDSIPLAFTNPVSAIGDSTTAKIIRHSDSSISTATILIDSSGLFALINSSLTSGEKYTIELADSIVRDIYGNYNNHLSINLTPKDYGTLTVHIDNHANTPLIIELLDKRDTVVAAKSVRGTSGALTFKHLAAGDYHIRAIVDADSNGQWTPGNYRMQLQPEKVIAHDKTFQLREKWEMEERWTIEQPIMVKSIDKIQRTRQITNPLEQ